MSVRLVGLCCCVENCTRPAREHGGHCTPCWMGLTPAERRFVTWCVEHCSVETDPLERLWMLPAVGHAHGEAA